VAERAAFGMAMILLPGRGAHRDAPKSAPLARPGGGDTEKRYSAGVVARSGRNRTECSVCATLPCAAGVRGCCSGTGIRIAFGIVPSMPTEPGQRNQTMTTALPRLISRFPVPELDRLPDDVRAKIVAVQEKSGFIPNVFLALAHRPDEFRAFVAYHDALMDKPGGLTKAEREMIVVATSGANQCQYCVVAHGAILRIRAKDPMIADQIAVNYRKADITARQRAMLDYAMKVSQAAETVDDTDFETLHAHGFSQDDAWDISAIAAFFAMSNRLANAISLRPNDEFYMLGRVPRA
jgi:uncharacterized peroxidase-related enzyme